MVDVSDIYRYATIVLRTNCCMKDYKLSKKYADWLKDSICSFQSDYIQHQYKVSEKHKALKDYLRDNRKDIDVSRLHELVEDLKKTTWSGTYEASEIAINHLKKYFRLENRSGEYSPRICTKTLDFSYNNDVGKYENYIVDLKRDRGTSPFSQYPLRENTGFVKVHQNGDRFIENDIPAAVKGKSYENKRINYQCVLNYKEKIFIKQLIQRIRPKNDTFKDKAWANCWDVGKNETQDKDSFYKSTLIVPMKLKKSEIEDEFYKKLLESEHADQYEYDELIFGYLCFDHRGTGFFNDDIDTKTGWIFSDLLSLYMISSLIYTEKSTTFSKAKKILEENAA